MTYPKLSEAEVKAMFTLAGIPVEKMRALTDGYDYSPNDPRFYDHPPRCVWWFVKTPVGWIELGWRKRIISINWEDTPVRAIVTDENVTKSETGVDAWSPEDALKYLRVLGEKMSTLKV